MSGIFLLYREHFFVHVYYSSHIIKNHENWHAMNNYFTAVSHILCDRFGIKQFFFCMRILFCSWNNRNKSSFHKFLALGAVLHLLGNIIGASVFLSVSYNNYPGGKAIMFLQNADLASKGLYCCFVDNWSWNKFGI